MGQISIVMGIKILLNIFTKCFVCIVLPYLTPLNITCFQKTNWNPEGQQILTIYTLTILWPLPRPIQCVTEHDITYGKIF